MAMGQARTSLARWFGSASASSAYQFSIPVQHTSSATGEAGMTRWNALHGDSKHRYSWATILKKRANSKFLNRV